jgi:hypothetical protein
MCSECLAPLSLSEAFGKKGGDRKAFTTEKTQMKTNQQMKKIITTFEKLLNQNKAKKNHFPSLRPTCIVKVEGAGSITVDLMSSVINEGSADDPDCIIDISSEAILKEVMAHPSMAWIYSGRGGEIIVSDVASAAVLLESLYPGTLAATMKPHQFYALFPNLTEKEYSGHTTEEFFNNIIPQKLVNNPNMLSTVCAAYQFNIEGAGIWTIDMTASLPQVYSGPAKTKGSTIATERKIFEEILNDDSKAWHYFNSGQIIVSNACRASQVVNALWPTAFSKAMPGSLHAALFPNEIRDPSASEYNKTTGDYITYIQGKNGPVSIHYSLLGDLAIYQGDIILGKADDMEHVRKQVEAKVPAAQGVRIRNDKYLWPQGVVFYTKDSSLTNDAAKKLKDAMDHWTTKTRISFKERTTEADYVVIKDSPGCSSDIGRRGGEQTIKLNKDCNFGNVVHEIGHTIGLFHEQCRIDRDTFVSIQTAQIQPEEVHNFTKQTEIAEDLGAYDYGSIMHYSAYEFAIGSKPTIITIPPGTPIGQRNGLSTGDIAAVASMYGAKAEAFPSMSPS